jgi:hypothetical protein
MSLKRAAKSMAALSKRGLASWLALSMILGGVVSPTPAQAPSASDDGSRVGVTSTLLPDRRELLTGGEGRRGVVDTAQIVDRGVATPLPKGLLHARPTLPLTGTYTVIVFVDGRTTGGINVQLQTR